MNDTIKALLNKTQELEQAFEDELEEQRRQFQYTIQEKKIRFEEVMIQHHKGLKIGMSRFVRDSGVIEVLMSPVIYVQIIPLLLLDVAVSLFQMITFTVYGIDKVPRDDFIAIDRHNLSYLNGIEKINCAFCGYANGLLAYTREIAGRAEEYWCPIKHARKTVGQHRRYYAFAEYGDADGYRARSDLDGKR